MVELSNERVEQILHEENRKKEDLGTILRSIYTRYTRLYERYFADIDALNDDAIAELRKYHEETRSLIRYFYMDIPLDICMVLKEFDEKYTDKLLGSEWHKYLFDNYGKFRYENEDEYNSEESLKEEFAKQVLTGFYEAMDYVFREGFGTGSQTTKNLVNGFTGLLFGKEK